MCPNLFKIFRFSDRFREIFALSVSYQLSDFIAEFLYSVHCFNRLQLSLKLCMCVISGVNQSGRRLVLTRFVLTGAWLLKCFKIKEGHATKSSSTISWSVTKVSRSLVSSARKFVSLKCL